MQISGPLVAEAPSLNSEPIQVSRPQLVLGNYPPTPDDLAVRSKSVSADAAPPSPSSSAPSLPPSIVQYFRCAWLLLLCCMLLMLLYVEGVILVSFNFYVTSVSFFEALLLIMLAAIG